MTAACCKPWFCFALSELFSKVVTINYERANGCFWKTMFSKDKEAWCSFVCLYLGSFQRGHRVFTVKS
jgi:hypothetical protein